MKSEKKIANSLFRHLHKNEIPMQFCTHVRYIQTNPRPKILYYFGYPNIRSILDLTY